MSKMVERPSHVEASEFSAEIVDNFANLHPGVLMSWQEWNDLREMIEREYIGGGISAADLVDDAKYISGRRTAGAK